MHKNLLLSLPPELAFNEGACNKKVRSLLGLNESDKLIVYLQKRSIDARSRQVKVNIELDAYVNEEAPDRVTYKIDFANVTNRPQAIIVGAGPAGLFAALRLIELGIKPIVLERGKDVRSRRRDLAAINKENTVNPDSNYCFGEGGAGTYSDGKLYTRSNKRGDVRRILEILVAHGAREEILIDAHPHIGTNKLPKLVAQLRETILHFGGEVHFDTRVTDLVLQNNTIKGVVTASGDKIEGIGVILATGHSARDVFELLHAKGVYVEEKPFAMGVRIEHPQELIDHIQYHGVPREEYLPAAAYALVAQTQFEQKQRGVFSFCMCPGGFIVPAATAPGEIVVNGMSPSKRDSKFANSGMVVAIEKEDMQPFVSFGPLAGLQLQKSVEQLASRIAGGTQAAPAQRMVDFVNKKTSASLPETSYIPGLVSVRLHEALPEWMTNRMRQAFNMFGSKMKGYLTNEAQLVGVESRTSSPVRIPRDKETLEHVQVKRLFPCAEGAGYAGGIVSAAMDGERCAEKLVELYNS
jgi:hypothetical protein